MTKRRNKSRDRKLPLIEEYPSAPKPKGKIWQMIIPVICSAHITKGDAEALNEDKQCRVLLFPPSEDGYLIHIGEDTDERWMSHPGLSDAFKDVLTTLQSLGYHYVRFDAGGDEFDDLPTFDW